MNDFYNYISVIGLQCLIKRKEKWIIAFNNPAKKGEGKDNNMQKWAAATSCAAIY